MVYGRPCSRAGTNTLYFADFNNPFDSNDDVLRMAIGAPADSEEFDGRTLIAGDEISDDRFFRGCMDDIHIYNYSLSPAEIKGLSEMDGKIYVPLNSKADLCVGRKDPCDPNNL